MGMTLTCAFAQWSPGLGDNHAMGWLTVVAYVVTAIAAARTARALGATDPLAARERRFWTSVAVLMLFLAVNKQMDLQSLVTMIGRCHAQLAGWYEMRDHVQRAFILGVAGSGVVALAVLSWWLRRNLGRVWLALVGLAFVCAFVVIRTASFHNVDVLILTTVAGIRLNWLLELPGPILVTLVALRRRGGVVSG